MEYQDSIVRGQEQTTPHTLNGMADLSRFLYAGNATLTARSKVTGRWFTFKVVAKKDGDVSFVSLLAGANNEADYRYLGLLRHDQPDRLVGVGRGKSCATPDAPSAQAFQYLLDFAWGKVEGRSLEVYHAGLCGRCGRKLTVPESIQTGLGPECANKL